MWGNILRFVATQTSCFILSMSPGGELECLSAENLLVCASKTASFARRGQHKRGHREDLEVRTIVHQDLCAPR